jgi:phage/plasmid-like protein (TIGR03299 family)
MAHEIESMFFVGQAPWHGLGTRLDGPPTVAEAIRAAGLDWTVRLDPLYAAAPDIQMQSDGSLVIHDAAAVKTDHFATRRESDGKVLGVVGPHYRPLQNVEAFAWFQPFLDAGLAKLHTAGSLRGGRRVWVLARLAGGPLEIAAGDVVERFVLLSNSHDGTLAVRVGFTPIRVVCANTLAMAHGSDASKLIRVKHTAGVRDNLDAIRDVMDLANQRFEATAEQYRRLAARTICQADVRKYVRKVFQVADDAQPSARLANILLTVEGLAEVGRGNDLPSVRGTWWAAYNGVTEYLGTLAGRNADSRLNSLWFGDAALTSRRALEVALEMAA